MKVKLLDRDLYATDPHPAFTWMRANQPVYHDTETDIWALALHEDVTWAERQPDVFSNGLKGSRPRMDRPQPSMIDTDDPFHAQQRRIVGNLFTRKQMAAYETHVREATRELIDAIAPLGHCDVVTHLAKPLPMRLIGEMLGADHSEHDTLQRWSDEMLTGSDGPENLTPAVAEAAFEYYAYAAKVVADRRANPREDLVSLLVHGEIDGQTMDDERIIGNMLLLLVGGNETTRNVITGGLHALLTHPEQMAKLQADASLVPSAVEECLRWVTPILNMNRTTTRDVEVRGVTIPEGASVLMAYVSANRDERVFDRPFEFDITRSPNPHIAFGFGPHLCLGAALARLEIKVMLEEVLRRLPDLRLADPSAPVTYSHSSFVRGIQSLPVTFTPTA